MLPCILVFKELFLLIKDVIVVRVVNFVVELPTASVVLHNEHLVEPLYIHVAHYYIKNNLSEGCIRPVKMVILKYIYSCRHYKDFKLNV